MCRRKCFFMLNAFLDNVVELLKMLMLQPFIFVNKYLDRIQRYMYRRYLQGTTTRHRHHPPDHSKVFERATVHSKPD